MDNKLYYLAIFEKDGDGYNVYFPDFEGCYTSGNSFEHAIKMATEALQGYCETVTTDFHEKLPAPADIAKIKTQEGQCIVPISLNVDTIK